MNAVKLEELFRKVQLARFLFRYLHLLYNVKVMFSMYNSDTPDSPSCLPENILARILIFNSYMPANTVLVWIS